MFKKENRGLNADNFSAENWNPEEFLKMMLEELDSVAGGRGMRPSESAELDAMSKRIRQNMDKMLQEGDFRSASEYFKMCCNCAEQFKKAIENAPEDGPDIPVSKFLNA